MRLKLEDNFPYSSIHSKLRFLSSGHRLDCHFFPIHWRNFGSFECCSSCFSQFSQFLKKMKKWVFEYKSMLYFQFFPTPLKSTEIGILEVPLISYFVKLSGQSFRHNICKRKRGDQIYNSIVSFQEKEMFIFI